MSDNITLNPGAAGDIVGADEIGGIKYQRVKIIQGSDGVNDGDVSSTNPLAVEISNTSPVNVEMNQVLDSNNTKIITSGDASPGSAWVGTWTNTRSIGIVRQLVVLSCSTINIGGTFTFEYSEDGITPTISETRLIDDFSTVRDFDLLNAGEYFRVKFEPSVGLVANTVIVTTTQRRQNDGQFARLGNQEIEEQNAALGSTFAYVKGFNHFTGKSANVRVDSYIPATVTATPLGINEVFDSGIASCEPYNYVVTEIFSNQSGVLTVSFYDDAAGTNLLRTFQRPYTAGEGFVIAGSILTRPYVRYVYTNGGVAQTVFHLATKVLNQSLGGQILGLSDFVPTNVVTAVNRAMIMGFNPAGVVKNVALNSSNALMSADFLTEVAKGAVAGHKLVLISGANNDVDTTITETIWNGADAGTLLYTPPTASSVITFTVNAADTGLGLIANIEGLDASGFEFTGPPLALNATSKNSANIYSAITRISLSGPTAPANAITATINGTLVANIIAGANITQNGYYHVPTGKTAYLIGLVASTSNNTASSRLVTLKHRPLGETLFRASGSFGGHSQGAATDTEFRAPYKFEAGSVIRVDIECGANNNTANCNLEILLIDN